MTTSQAGPAVLSLGAVLGDSGPENMAWRRAVSSLGKKVAEAREGVESPLRLNVVFHIDGTLVPNEFEGVRTGRFSSRDSHLLVQAAVPAEATAERNDVLVLLLQEAIDEAESFARSRGIAQDLNSIRSLVESAVSG